jgi:hypothetical protein
LCYKATFLSIQTYFPSDEAIQSPSIFENVSITTAILKIGSFIPQNVFALAEEALHGGTGRHRRVVTQKAKTRLGRELTPAEYENEILTVPGRG